MTDTTTQPDKGDNAGESSGGAYPNPHTGKDGGGRFDGGQSDKAYRGGGDAADGGDNPNDATLTDE